MYNKDAKYNRKLFLENIDNRIDEYKSGKSIKKLSEENNVSQKFISELFINLGIKNPGRRKYSLNEEYFDIIDTQDKAYYLGLLYADGCNNVSRNAIHLDLQIDDREIIEKFSEDIGSNRPLRQIIKRDSYIGDRLIKADNIKPQIGLELSSKHLSNSLVKRGMVQNKSLVLTFPDIPDFLHSHFIRGYFDGDGSFYTFQDNGLLRCGFKIISTFDFCNSVNKIFQNKLGVNLSLQLAHPEENDITSVLQTLSKKNVIKIMDWLYYDANRYLERKHSKYLAFLNELNNSLSD